MKYNILKTGVLAVSLLGLACTGNYDEINSNPYEVTGEQMQTNGYIIAASLSAMAGTVISPDVNTTQFTECLLGGPMGGYFVSSNPGWATTIDNYNATDDWTRVFMASDRIIPMLYSNLANLQDQTTDPVVLAIAKVIKVAAMHRVTDTYGPIPYSKIEVGGAIQVPYDSQEVVFDTFFAELDEAIEVLTANRTGGISSNADIIYGGKAESWCKLANSLKLRLAMRIVYANPTKAQQMAEEAVSHEVGVFSSNADNAYIKTFGGAGNPVYVAVNYNANGNPTGGDTHVAADITSYMNALEDPRREKFFSTSLWDGVDYSGMRRGIIIPPFTIGGKYSGVNITSTSALCWINAAEVAFLKAEASAVFGFTMPGGTAADFYAEGIRLSFDQWGADGADAYMAQSAAVQVVYEDPSTTNSYGTPLSTLNVAWDEAATPAQKQERIITQKWIANWILGNEAWADYRRTGFPRLIPATEDGNKSGGIVDSEMGARRMPYPQIEATTNAANYQTAVSSLLGGPDNMATRMWWDQNPAIN